MMRLPWAEPCEQFCTGPVCAGAIQPHARRARPGRRPGLHSQVRIDARSRVGRRQAVCDLALELSPALDLRLTGVLQGRIPSGCHPPAAHMPRGSDASESDTRGNQCLSRTFAVELIDRCANRMGTALRSATVSSMTMSYASRPLSRFSKPSRMTPRPNSKLCSGAEA